MRLANIQQQEAADEVLWRTKWDFFTGGCGSKPGYVTEMDSAGCTLKTSEPIEFRRWIRMIIRESGSNVGFTAVGRIVRCENSFEAAKGAEVTLYRYRVEFTYPVPMGHPEYSQPQEEAPRPMTQATISA